MAEVRRGGVQILDAELWYLDFGSGPPEEGVYLQGGLHGNEVLSYPTLLKLAALLEVVELPGAVRIVPCANPFGWDAFRHGQAGRLSFPNGHDWNRIFDVQTELTPGTVESALRAGLVALSEPFGRVLDVHTPEYGLPHIYALQRAFAPAGFDDLPHVLTAGPSSAFEDFHAQAGRPAATVELPSTEPITEALVERWAQRLLRAVLEGQSQGPLVTGRLENTYAPIGGVLALAKELGSVVEEGGELVRVYGGRGDVAVLNARHPCVPLCFRRRQMINAGSWVVRSLVDIKQRTAW